MARLRNGTAGWWIEIVGPLLMLVVLAADNWLPTGQAASADLKVILLGLVAIIAWWAGTRSALLTGGVLVGVDFYARFFTGRNGSFEPESWVHVLVLLVAAALIAVLGGLRKSAGSEAPEVWSTAAPDRSDDSIRRVDVVTGLLNRRFAVQLARMEWDRWRRVATPFSLLLVEVDGLESIRRSDPALADSLLRVLANRMTSVLRAMDVAGRFEGGQFLVVLPQTNHAGSLVAGEKLLKVARQTRMEGYEGNFSATFSIGAAGVLRSDDRLQDVLLRAEDALRRALAASGDCIAGQEPASSGRAAAAG